MKCATIVAAFAATAFANEYKFEKRQDPAALQVLATALPESLLQLAITNSAAAASVISSQFAAGETPGWFSGLPNNVKTQLVPAVPAVATPAATPRPSMGAAMPYGTNNTMAGVAGGTGAAGPTAPGFSSSSRAPSGSTTSSSSSEPTDVSGGAQTSAPDGNGAAGLPTGAISFGIAGAIGLMFVLAL